MAKSAVGVHVNDAPWEGGLRGYGLGTHDQGGRWERPMRFARLGAQRCAWERNRGMRVPCRVRDDRGRVVRVPLPGQGRGFPAV